MTSPDRGSLRVVRAAAIAFCIVGMSLVAHLFGGGSMPSLAVVALTTAATCTYAGKLTRGELGLGELIAVLGSGQIILHTVFMVSSGHHATGLTMIGAHVVATIVIAVALAYGERAAWSLWCWMRPLLKAPRLETEHPCAPPERLADANQEPVRLTWIGTAVTPRGPPLFALHHR